MPLRPRPAYAGVVLDLYRATRDELIRIILEQRDALADRDRQIAPTPVCRLRFVACTHDSSRDGPMQSAASIVFR